MICRDSCAGVSPDVQLSFIAFYFIAMFDLWNSEAFTFGANMHSAMDLRILKHQQSWFVFWKAGRLWSSVANIAFFLCVQNGAEKVRRQPRDCLSNNFIRFNSTWSLAEYSCEKNRLGKFNWFCRDWAAGAGYNICLCSVPFRHVVFPTAFLLIFTSLRLVWILP